MEGGGSSSLIDAAARILEGLGLPGLLIGALAWFAWMVYKRNNELQDAMREMTKDSVRAQEAATAAIRELTNMLLRGKAE